MKLFSNIQKLILVVSLVLISSNLFAQKKKEIRSANIRQKVEWRYLYENDKEIKYKEYETQYDKQGNTLMEKTFDEKGNIVSHYEYKYDSNGNEILKITYSPKGSVLEKVETRYTNGLKTEKKVYGPTGKLKSRKVFEYH